MAPLPITVAHEVFLNIGLLTLEADKVYHSVVLPGFWLRVEWLWQRPLPNASDILLKVSGETYARYLIDRLHQGGFLET